MNIVFKWYADMLVFSSYEQCSLLKPFNIWTCTYVTLFLTECTVVAHLFYYEFVWIKRICYLFVQMMMLLLLIFAVNSLSADSFILTVDWVQLLCNLTQHMTVWALSRSFSCFWASLWTWCFIYEWKSCWTPTDLFVQGFARLAGGYVFRSCKIFWNKWFLF